MSYSEKIKRLRKDKGITQKELAEKLEISQPMLAQLERGTKALSVNMAVAIAKALKVPINEIIG